ncbi:Glycosyltransferase [hydrothermal vent metagenome]|uniref:Glycosyltransferase n=1 Tax=hydrothermal vent metagenome TaxID=652676 RepID=A0A1W1C5B4_9ZZZZ
MHHIQDLAEEFIFFNDDFFIVSPLEKERFFKDGLPCDAFVSNAISSSEGVGHFVLNNLEILNRHFHKRDTFKSHFRKVFNLKYGFDGFVRNVALSLWPRFTGFVDPHMPQPFLKSTFEEVWEREKKILDQTSASKFRNCDDTNQYLFRYWQLAKGAFSPVSMKDTKYLTLSMQNLKSGEVTEAITSEKYAMICLNDNEAIGSQEDFEEAKRIIGDAFEKLLPEKSSFEL